MSDDVETDDGGMANERQLVTGQRLGRLPLKTTRKALQFADFFRFVRFPERIAYWTRATPLPRRTFGNDSTGNCTRAKQAYAAIRMERIEQKRTIQITDAEVVRVYTDMSNRLYGGGDNGAYEDDALNEWRNPETTIRDTKGHPLTIDAYLRINALNHQEVHAGLALSGAKGLAVCFNLPVVAQRMEHWDVPEGQPLIGPWQPGSWGGHCVAPETPIPLLNGETVPIVDLVGQERLWVYGCLPNSQPVPAMARAVVRTKRAQTVRVHVDYGPAIRTTRDHPWMLRDGSYLRADQLQPGTRLMPLRRLVHHRGYEKVKWYDGAKRQAFTHRLVSELVNGAGPQDVTDHLDGNKRNNHPSNLMVCSQSDHMRRHRPWEQSSATGTTAFFATEAGRTLAKQIAAGRRRNNSGQFIPASENHKVVAVEPAGEDWVYDLIDVSPTGNFAAGSVFVHNSMWLLCDYDDAGGWLDDTWAHGPRKVSWRFMAAYMDEAHLVIDSVDAWRAQSDDPKVLAALGDVVDEVNAISSLTIRLA